MIRLLFSTGPGFQHAFIRWATRCEYSHVDLVLPDERLLGALPGRGVMVRQPAVMNGLLLNAPRVPESAIDIAMSQLGKPYDWGAVIGRIGFNRDWEDPSKWFCSELIAWAAKQAGRPLLRDDWVMVNSISPRDLLLSGELEPC